MPTTIPASSRARRHPVRSRGRSSDMLACAAAVGLLLAVLALNFEISLGANSGANSVAAATENVPAIP
jgi:hypothetical protein